MNLRAEPAVSRDAAELEAARNEIESLSYSVSHELRAPLRAIRGYTDMLLGKSSALERDESTRMLKQVRENAEHMNRLIDGLLHFSRAASQTLGNQRMNVSELVRAAVAELRASEPQRNIEVSIGKLPACWGDRPMLREVFNRLLANAFKFTATREKAVIRIGGRSSRTETIYFVRDNGVGFDMRYADKLFGVFQRLHAADEFPGTGVSLSVVQRIVTRHRGRVWAEAKPAQGATFYVALPKPGANGHEMSFAARGEKNAPRLKLRVLTLEDNPYDRQLIGARLAEDFDCEMTVAGGRREFEAALKEGTFDLILSDYALPQFDGVSALHIVRKKNPDVPFILISGTLGEEQAVECLKAGATDFVLKQRLVRLGPAVRRALRDAQDRVRQRQADQAVHELSGRLLRVQDEERRRIARELHDSLAQNLLALSVNLHAAQRLDKSGGKLHSLLVDSVTLTDETTNAIRTLSYLLHPPVLDAIGLGGALSDYVAGFARRSGIKVELSVPERFGRLPGDVEMALFRVVQESLTNVHRHSGSARATIELQRGREEIVLEIQDFGDGISPEVSTGQTPSLALGVGIAGMRERLQQLGGRLQIESSSAGTRVLAVVPNRSNA
ncbi:MAG TPA: ATP-binding protein [Candidatus Limnocylindria bacterium]|nr:ATP-binding protein [Candidatus Limnocylindria bacterium]